MAEEYAAKHNGVIINADSMQVYKGLEIITAQPQPAKHHRLYGFLTPETACNAALWRQVALKEIDQALAHNQRPILVGGTGMYIKSLIEGIAKIPSPPDELLASLMQQDGAENYQQLENLDKMHGLKAGDKQRIIRALAVLKHTGKPLRHWQQTATPLPYSTHTIQLTMERERLYKRINQRFVQQLNDGALEEVQQLSQKKLPSTLPAMKAHGVPELIDYLNGHKTLEEATSKAQQNVRNYAKRQATWFRHQMVFDEVI